MTSVDDQNKPALTLNCSIKKAPIRDKAKGFLILIKASQPSSSPETKLQEEKGSRVESQ